MPKQLAIAPATAPIGGTIEQVSALDLELDPFNPRLSRREEGRPQNELLAVMIRQFKIDEIAESIIAAGYVPIDPLLGVREGGRIRVVEGNRRVAAIQLLLNPELAPAHDRPSWQLLSNRLSSAFRTQIGRLAIRVYDSRKDPEVASYIGFRHVRGPLRWPALEKAGYIAYLIQLKWTYTSVAERLGATPRQIEKHYVAFQVAHQAVDLELPGADSLESLFGVLLRALQSPGVQDFLGIEYPNDPIQSRVPVKKSRLRNFRDFVAWTFGVESGPERVLRDSRDLTKWGVILSSQEAVAYLRRADKPRFQQAWLRSGGEDETLTESLRSAADRLQESVALVAAHKQDKSIKQAVDRVTAFFVQIIPSFPESRRKYGVRLSDD